MQLLWGIFTWKPSVSESPTCWLRCWGSTPSGCDPLSGRSRGWNASAHQRLWWQMFPVESRWSVCRWVNGWQTPDVSADGTMPHKTSGQKRNRNSRNVFVFFHQTNCVEHVLVQFTPENWPAQKSRADRAQGWWWRPVAWRSGWWHTSPPR